MSVSGQAGPGEILLFNDFCGPELPVEGTGEYADVNYAGIHSGPFKVTGDLEEDDTGLVSIAKANGFARISGNNENGKGVFVGTEVVFSPVLNGTMVCEARLELQALTTRSVFVGFMGTNADDVAEPVTSTGTAITKVVPCLGFILDSQITDGTRWHMPYLLASDTTQTSTVVDATQVAVAGESDILRIEVDNNGAARWYINGKLEQTVGAGLAATTTTLMAGGVGCWGTESTAADADVDYLLIKANRDWTR